MKKKDRIISLLKEGKSYRQILDIMERENLSTSKSTISFHAKKLGIAKVYSPPELDLNEVQKFYDENGDARKTRQEFKISVSLWRKLQQDKSISVKELTYFDDAIIDWKNGNIPQILTEHIKKYIKQKYNYTCTCCGWNKINPVSKSCPVEVDHINGNSEDNREENLTLLCPNCHSLTPTWKALNRGQGRHSRRERYKEGKSY